MQYILNHVLQSPCPYIYLPFSRTLILFLSGSLSVSVYNELQKIIKVNILFQNFVQCSVKRLIMNTHVCGCISIFFFSVSKTLC